jgi:tetratricopeptide (TPR) repeat protein
MYYRCWLWSLSLALSWWSIVGCHSPSGQHPKSAIRAPSDTRPVVRPAAAAKADPDQTQRLARAHAHFAASVIHDMNGEAAEALEDLYQAAMEDPQDESLILETSRRLLTSRHPDNNLERALQLLTLATQQPNASGALFARLGVVYTQQGKFDQAAAADQAAIKRSPDLLIGYQNLFLNYLQSKKEVEALKVLDDAAKQPNASPEFLIGLSELYRSYGLQYPAQYDKIKPKTLAALNQAAKLGPLAPSLRLRLAAGFNAMGDSNQAAQTYLDLLKQLPNLPFVRESVRAELAEIYANNSDRKRAIEQLEAILHDEPSNPRVNFFLGRLYHLEKKLPEAVQYFNKTILLDPDFTPAYYELALLQIDQNQPDDALSTLEKARKKFPQTVANELYTGLAYNRKKEYREAIRHFTEAEIMTRASEKPEEDGGSTKAAIYFQLGAAYERVGDYAQAEQYFQRCLRIDPNAAEVQNYLGYMWAEHDMNLEQARDLIEKAVKSEPKNAAFLDSLGWVLFKLKQPKEALEYVLQAVDLSKDEPDATLYDHLGDIYQTLNQPEKAREAWTRSLALEPSDPIRKKLESSQNQ